MKFSNLILVFLSITVCTFLVSCAGITDGALSSSAATKKLEQALIVYFTLSNDKFGTEEERAELFKLQSKLEKIVEDKNLGLFDGNDFGAGECTFYMYGPSCDALEKAVIPTIKDFGPKKGSRYLKRYGAVDDKDAKEVTVKF